MEDDLSLKFDDDVVRVSDSTTVKVRDLGLGGEFEHDGKRYRITTKRVPFASCESGQRVRLWPSGSWKLVWRHGRENIPHPLVDGGDPFSDRKEGSFSLEDLPYPQVKVEVLTFEPVAPSQLMPDLK